MKGLLARANIDLKSASFWLKFAAYALPGAFLLYVLYWNFLPFGYDKTFTITVGAPGDTSGEFRLEPSKNLSEPKVAPDGATYRELNGIAYAVFEPKAVLRNATITVSVEGSAAGVRQGLTPNGGGGSDNSGNGSSGDNGGVYLIPPHIDFDPSTVAWDYAWDFTKELPKFLKGDAFYDANQAGVYFDGASKLEMPTSANILETGPFSVYAEWMPQDATQSAQQIVGHYNWELWQNSTSVEFRVGRMNDATGPAYSIKYPIVNSEAFFNAKHTALATYNPGTNGYIELFIDGNFAGRTYIGTDTIWKDYNANKNLSFGKSDHGVAKYFVGDLYTIKYLTKKALPEMTTINFVVTKNSNNRIPLAFSTTNAIISKINLYAVQK